MASKHSVLERYSEGAQDRQPDLCCPVDYDSSLLALLPQEIIDKDYGCGDPSRYVRKGDIVLDLGAGSGKICYMAAQIVGKNGQVIGLDMNDDMLTLARKYQPEMESKLGDDRVKFVKGLIEDLTVDLEAMDKHLAEHPVTDSASLTHLQSWQVNQSKQMPLIKDNSIDLVVSNCVLNLVQDSEKNKMINEIFRVVKPGGRVAISDIISDEHVPDHLKADPTLWSGCISGALQEEEMLIAFVDAGFVAVSYDKWESEPYRKILWKSNMSARSMIAKYWKIVDVALPSVDDEKNLFDFENEEDVVTNLVEFGVKFGALKRGAKGPCSLSFNNDNNTYEIVSKVIDSTAAGDSFNGAYLASLLNGSSQLISLLNGHKLASKVIKYNGAILPV